MSATTKRTILIIIVVLVVCCLTVLGSYLAYRMLNRPGQASAPLVYFNHPDDGSTVIAGDPIQVHIIARDRAKISRVEFWVNGALVENERSPLDGGISPFPLSADWTPSAAGDYTLTARTYNTAGASATAEIHIRAGESEARAEPDRDGDSFPDSMDACPDTPGLEPDGCPVAIADADGDGVEDSLDECPDVAGAATAEGCPDRDGDGIRDDLDACPDEIGAGDSPAGMGCPSTSTTDRDGDGVADGEDGCPDEPGPTELAGCPATEGGGFDSGGGDESVGTGSPDSDGDGLSDDEDRCPDEAGPAESGGCPEGSADRDGDGFPDSVDACPDEAGIEPDGCPAPETESSSEGGIAPGSMRFVLPAPHFAEFQALSFEVSADYTEVNCYASITAEAPELYGPFHLNGERSWDLTEYIGSVSLMNPADPIPVYLECYAVSGAVGAPEYHFLGIYQATHPEADWNGQIQTAWVGTEGGGEGFQATYRICQPSCAAVDLPAPVLSMRDDPFMGRVLAWSWPGNADMMDHYNIYVNGSLRREMPGGYSGMSIASYAPECGEELTFEITAAAGEHESARSNAVTWTGSDCPRRVRVTFTTLITHDIRDGARIDEVGPIRGSFWAGEDSLDFDADDYPWYGFVLDADGSTPVNSIFYTINQYNLNHELCGGHACHGFYAPEVNYIDVDVPEGESLTVGARITDADPGDDENLINQSETIPYDQIIPSRRVIRNRHMEMVYYIDVVSGPGSEAGDGSYPPPDLIVTDVSHLNADGDLAIRVDNIGAGPMVNQPLHVQYRDRLSGDILFEETYPDMDIPLDDYLIFSPGRIDLPLYNSTVVINPDHAVEESNYNNDTFNTPVLLQVSLISLRDSSACDPDWMTYTEHKYNFRVGYGEDESDITWTANLDYPEHGFYLYEIGSTEDILFPAATENRFNTQIIIYEDMNLYVQVRGWEVDLGEDDDEGTVKAFYFPASYIRDGVLSDHALSDGGDSHNCEDYSHPEADFYGFEAEWEIQMIEE